MNRFADLMQEFLDKLDYDDVMLLKEHSSNGKIEDLIMKRAKEVQTKARPCPTCSAVLEKDKSIVLQFGPKDFRKEARFCGVDCLMYFLQNMKDVAVFQ